MARLHTGSFETNDVTLEGITLGAGAFSTSAARTGTYGLRHTAFTSVTYVAFSGVTGQTYYFRTYLRFSALPGSNDAQVRIMDNLGNPLSMANITTAGKVQLLVGAGSTQVGSDSTITLGTNTWYCVELSVRINAGVSDDHAALQVTVDTPGASPEMVASTTTANIGVTAPGRAGVIGSNSSNFDFDDWALNDDQGASQNTWPGQGKCVLFLPISDNARATLWTGGAGGTTSLFEAVNNTPPIGTATETNLTQIEHAGGSGTTSDAYDANLPTYRAAGLNGNNVAHSGELVGAPLSQLLGNVTGNTRIAQSFLADAAAPTTIEVALRKVGTPTDNVELAIQADSSGAPSGTDLASAILDGSTLTTSAAWVAFTVSGLALTGAATYWIVLRRSAAVDASNYYVAAGSTSISYPGGGTSTYNGTVWTAVHTTNDLFFNVMAPGADTVNCQQFFMVDGEDVSTGTKLLRLDMNYNPRYVGANVTAGGDVGALGTYPSNWSIHRNTLTYDNRISYGDAPVIRVVRPETASRVASVCFVGMLVDYTPAAAPPYRHDLQGRPYGASGQRQMQQLLSI